MIENPLQLQIETLQQSIPDQIMFRGKLTTLNKKQRLASGRAIWYIIQKGWGLHTSVQKASGSFNCSQTLVERAVRGVFPSNYFTKLQKNKNKSMFRQLEND